MNHITFVGGGRTPASVEFGPGLTAIVGPSDTGKSYILDSIDFMLGAKKLRPIPEADGYTHLLLGVTIVEGATFTLVRSLSGGKVDLYREDLRDVPTTPPQAILAEKHNADNVKNVSNFLLTEIEITGRRVRKNARNTTRSLSFRDLAHLCVISETKIQAENSPLLPSDSYINKTVEKSVLKLLLEGDDDSELIESASDEEIKISRGKSAMLDRVITELTKEQDGLPSDAQQQLSRLELSIEAHSSAIEGAVADRDRVMSRRKTVSAALVRQRERVTEIEELTARFGLLSDQYTSDLSRLDMLKEGGTLLNLFEPDICMLCGATKEHQRHESESVIGAENLDEAVTAETAKTEALLADLRATINEMAREKNGILDDITGNSEELVSLNGDLARLDKSLEPSRIGLRELTSTKSRIEKGLLAQDQIWKVEQLRGAIEVGTTRKPSADGFAVAAEATSELCESVLEILNSWGMPEATSARIDEEAELVVGGRGRASRGKGTRAILHSAFTLGLAQYCISREAEHPGFVVLDSPLVTYRQPDPGEDEDVPVSVANSFFRYLAEEFDGQSIVLENQDPPADLVGEFHLIEFTKRTGSGRYGLFPV